MTVLSAAKPALEPGDSMRVVGDPPRPLTTVPARVGAGDDPEPFQRPQVVAQGARGEPDRSASSVAVSSVVVASSSARIASRAGGRARGWPGVAEDQATLDDLGRGRRRGVCCVLRARGGHGPEAYGGRHRLTPEVVKQYLHDL